MQKLHCSKSPKHREALGSAKAPNKSTAAGYMKDVLQLYVPQIAWVCPYFLSHPPSDSEEVAKNEALWINCRSIFLDQGGGPQLSQERTDVGTQAMP